MNKIFLILFFILSYTFLKAQEQTNKIDAQPTSKEAIDTLPYLKYPTLPAFNILELDSETIFNTYNIPKGKPTALLFFDPDCKHCKATIKRLLQGMDSINNIQFYVFSPRPDLSLIKQFNDRYHLDRYKNIKVVGRDYEFFFFSFYKVKFVPDLALYDENKKLLKLFDNGVSVQDLYDFAHK